MGLVRRLSKALSPRSRGTASPGAKGDKGVNFIGSAKIARIEAPEPEPLPPAPSPADPELEPVDEITADNQAQVSAPVELSAPVEVSASVDVSAPIEVSEPVPMAATEETAATKENADLNRGDYIKAVIMEKKEPTVSPPPDFLDGLLGCCASPRR